MKNFLILVCAAVALTACTGKPSNADEASKSKSLVVYYSQNGATKQVANLLAKAVGAYIDSITAVVPYDGNFEETIARCQEEFKNGEVPEVNPISCDVAAYDTIYIGYPIWFGTVAQPMAGWLKTANLDGKVIVPFCTFGSGGLNSSTEAIKKSVPNATFIEGYGVRNARIDKAAEEIETFLIKRGIKAGKVAEEQPFSEQKQLTQDDKNIYDAACGDYPMPLGTPVSVGSRSIEGGTEYLFIANSKSPNGEDTQAKIYVVASDEEGAKPEFTNVDR